MTDKEQSSNAVPLTWWGEVTTENFDEVVAKNLEWKPLRLQLFQDVKELMEKHNIVYWIDCGTLLAAYRGGQMIGHDSDTDFSIYEKEEFDRLRQVLQTELPEKYGFKDGTSYSEKFEVYLKDMEQIQFSETVFASAVACDIYLYTHNQEDNTLKQEYYGFKLNERVYQYDWVFPMKTMTFEGFECPVPNDTEAFLKETYGYLGTDSYYDKEECIYKKRGT